MLVATIPATPFSSQAADDVTEIGIRNVGRDLQQDRLRPIFARDGLQQDDERIVFLQRAQTRGVRRTDVQHDVIGEFVQQAERLQVIFRRIFQRRHFRFSDVDPDWDARPATARAQFAQALRR